MEHYMIVPNQGLEPTRKLYKGQRFWTNCESRYATQQKRQGSDDGGSLCNCSQPVPAAIRYRFPEPDAEATDALAQLD